MNKKALKKRYSQEIKIQNFISKPKAIKKLRVSSKIIESQNKKKNKSLSPKFTLSNIDGSIKKERNSLQTPSFRKNKMNSKCKILFVSSNSTDIKKKCNRNGSPIPFSIEKKNECIDISSNLNKYKILTPEEKKANSDKLIALQSKLYLNEIIKKINSKDSQLLEKKKKALNLEGYFDDDEEEEKQKEQEIQYGEGNQKENSKSLMRTIMLPKRKFLLSNGKINGRNKSNEDKSFYNKETRKEKVNNMEIMRKILKYTNESKDKAIEDNQYKIINKDESPKKIKKEEAENFIKQKQQKEKKKRMEEKEKNHNKNKKQYINLMNLDKGIKFFKLNIKKDKNTIKEQEAKDCESKESFNSEDVKPTLAQIYEILRDNKINRKNEQIEKISYEESLEVAQEFKTESKKIGLMQKKKKNSNSSNNNNIKEDQIAQENKIVEIPLTIEKKPLIIKDIEKIQNLIKKPLDDTKIKDENEKVEDNINSQQISIKVPSSIKQSEKVTINDEPINKKEKSISQKDKDKDKAIQLIPPVKEKQISEEQLQKINKFINLLTLCLKKISLKIIVNNFHKEKDSSININTDEKNNIYSTENDINKKDIIPKEEEKNKDKENESIKEFSSNPERENKEQENINNEYNDDDFKDNEDNEQILQSEKDISAEKEEDDIEWMIEYQETSDKINITKKIEKDKDKNKDRNKDKNEEKNKDKNKEDKLNESLNEKKPSKVNNGFNPSNRKEEKFTNKKVEQKGESDNKCNKNESDISNLFDKNIYLEVNISNKDSPSNKVNNSLNSLKESPQQEEEKKNEIKLENVIKEIITDKTNQSNNKVKKEENQKSNDFHLPNKSTDKKVFIKKPVSDKKGSKRYNDDIPIENKKDYMIQKEEEQVIKKEEIFSKKPEHKSIDQIADEITDEILNKLIITEINSNNKTLLPKKNDSNRTFQNKAHSSLGVSGSVSYSNSSLKNEIQTNIFTFQNKKINTFSLNQNDSTSDPLNTSIFMKTIDDIKKEANLNNYNNKIAPIFISKISEEINSNYNTIVDNLNIPYKYNVPKLINEMILKGKDNVNNQRPQFENINEINNTNFLQKSKILSEFEQEKKNNINEDIPLDEEYYDNIINECIIDATNELISNERVYKHVGEPLPWSIRAKEIKFKLNKDPISKKKFNNKVISQLNELLNTKMGPIAVNFEYLDKDQLNMDSEKKLVKNIKKELSDEEEEWKVLETEETKIKVIQSNMILSLLLNEVVEILEHIELSRKHPERYQYKSIYGCEDIPPINFDNLENYTLNDEDTINI